MTQDTTNPGDQGRDPDRDPDRDPVPTAPADTADVGETVRENIESGSAGEGVGEGIGGMAGLVAGAAIGSLGGPIGTIIGAAAGAIGGWWAGKEAADAANAYNDVHDERHRGHFESRREPGAITSYDAARPAYQLGHVAAQNPAYAGRSFDEIEPDLRRAWTSDLEARHGAWAEVRGAVGTAYDEARRRG